MPNNLIQDPLRLEALYQSELLDSPSERVFDRITEMVCRLLGVPVSLVSLVDAERQFFKSAQGLAEPVASERQTPLSHSFCQHVVSRNQPLIVEDARTHPLVCDNLAIRDLSVIAYLGIPILLPDGQVAGSLCAIDSKPRVWHEDDIQTLSDLAKAVNAEIQVRHLLDKQLRTTNTLRKQAEQLKLAADVAGMGLFEWDFKSNTFEIDANLHRMYGSEPGQDVNLERFLSLVHPDDVQNLQQKLGLLAEGGDPANLEFRLLLADGERWILSKSHLLRNAQGEAEKLVGVNFDITEQKRLQLALQESEATFSRVFETAATNLGLFTFPEFKAIQANDSYLQDFAVTREELIGHSTIGLIEWASVSRRDHFMELLITQGHVRDFEADFIMRAGDIQCHLMSADVLEMPVGPCVLIAGKNITHLKKLEESLKESEERYRLISNVASDYMFSVKVLPDGTFETEWITETFATITGYTFKEFIDRGGWQSIVHPDDLALDNAKVAELHNNQAVHFELRIIHKEGRGVWVNNHIHPVWDNEKNCLLRIHGSVQDITERKQMELALRESEQRFSQLFQRSPFTLTIASLETGRLMEVNQTFLQRTGYSRDEVIGKTTTELGLWVHPQQRNELVTLAKQYGSVSNFEMESRARSGEVRIGLCSAYILEIKGEKQLVVAVRDISAEKKAQKALQDSERKFSKLFHRSPVSMLVTSLKNYQIVDVNDTFLQTSGFAREDIIGKTSLELGVWSNLEDREKFLKLFNQQGFVKDFETIFCDGNRQYRSVLFSAEFIELEGEKYVISTILDITEQRQAEKTLRESEQKFSKLFAGSPVAMVVTSYQDHKIMDVNESFLREGGYLREEVIGKTAYEIGAWTHVEETEAFIQAFQAQGCVKNFEATMHKKDGQLMHTILSAEVIELNGDKHVLSTILDTTQQRLAEQTLRESEQKFSSLFHNSPFAISLSSTDDGRIVDVNASFVRETGYAYKEVIGKTAADLNTWMSEEVEPRLIQLFREQGCIRNFPVEMRMRDGRSASVLLWVESLEISGKPFMVSTLLDVTTQRRAEEALRDSEAKFFTLFHNNPSPIFVISAKDSCIVDFNEAFLREGGYRREDILGKTAQDLDVWVYPEDEIKFIQLLQNTGKVRSLEVSFRKPSGTINHSLVSADLVEINHEYHVVATTLDVTAQRKAEQTLRESEARFERIFQNSPFGVLLIDIEADQIVDVNEKFIQDTGYSREEILTTPSFGHNLWVSTEAKEQASRLLDEQGYIKDFDFQFRCKSGEIGWAQTSAEFFESNGKRYMIRTNRNITDLRQMEEALQEERNLLRTLIDALPDYITVKDKQSRFILANQSTIDHMKMDPKTIIGSTDYDYYPKHLADAYFQKEQHVMQTGEMLLHHEEENMAPDGTPQWVMTTKVPLSNHHGDIVGLIASSRDITGLKRAEQALRESEERYRIVAETARDAILTIDQHSVIHYLNPGTEEMFGYTEVELLNQKITLLMPDYLQTFHEVAMAHYLETGIRKHDWGGVEITGLHKNGREIPLEISFSEFFKEGNRFFTGIIRDISERKLLLNRLEQMAYRDVLTNLPNRAMLRERLDYLLKHQSDTSGLALLFIDLDNFKIINDSLGHEFGDEALKVISRRLGDTVRSDDMVARLGGDEFVVLLNNVTSCEDITRVAQKILYRLDYPIHIQNHEVRLGGSMGIALYPQDGRTAMDLLRSADLAMYQAKKEKSVFKFYTKELNERAQERLSLESELRVALANHEISVHYQPRIDLMTGRITGAEALARWMHPQKGFISPGRFIPIAEESGLIHSLGLNVLRQACLQLRQWQKKGYPFFRVSVNLAPQQLHHPNLVSNIQSILGQTGLEPSYLELEVTESGAMSNIKESMPTLQAFRDMGIHIAVDDFGTGYSSLSYLQRLPIDSLKIDRSFLMDIGTSERASGEVIARVITSLGKNLGLNVVAEGIETPQQLKFLLQIHCDEAQGFLFSKPLTATDFENYLMTHNTKNLLMQFKQKHPTLFEF